MEDGELKCDTCGHLSSNILDYADHAVDVHLMQFILCPKCPIDDDSILYKKKNLLKHDKSDHGKFFLCVLCKKEVNVSNYRKHQYEHIQKSKVAFCAWCAKRYMFRNERSFLRHQYRYHKQVPLPDLPPVRPPCNSTA